MSKDEFSGLTFFISYSREARDFASQVAELIKDCGGDRFMDVRDISTAHDIDIRIEQVISNVDAFIFLASRHNVDFSRYARRELRAALSRSRKTESGKPVVFCFYLDDVRIEELEKTKRARKLICRMDQSGERELRDDFAQIIKSDIRAGLKSGLAVEENGAGVGEKHLKSEKSTRLQIIGWRGVGRFGAFAQGGGESIRISMLTTESSMEYLPPFRYLADFDVGPSAAEKPAPKDGEIFDAVYVDYEFSHRYYEEGRIENLYDPKIATTGEEVCLASDFGDDANEILKDCMNWHSVQASTHVPAIPIQFGFQEPLVYTTSTGNSKQQIRHPVFADPDVVRHEHFDIESILRNSDADLYLWHWYMPTMTQIFLSFFFGEAGQSCLTRILSQISSGSRGGANSSLELAFAAIGGTGIFAEDEPRDLMYQEFKKYVLRIERCIQKYKSRVTVTRGMRDLRSALKGRSDRNKIVLGVGSSALIREQNELPPPYNSIIACFPEQGVPMWVNCIGRAIPMRQEVPVYALIRRLLDEQVQYSMFEEMDSYVGLPSAARAVKRVVATHLFDEMHIVRTYNHVEKNRAKMPLSNLVHLRVFPEYCWGEWVLMWERLKRAAR